MTTVWKKSLTDIRYDISFSKTDKKYRTNKFVIMYLFLYHIHMSRLIVWLINSIGYLWKYVIKFIYLRTSSYLIIEKTYLMELARGKPNDFVVGSGRHIIIKFICCCSQNCKKCYGLKSIHLSWNISVDISIFLCSINSDVEVFFFFFFFSFF